MEGFIDNTKKFLGGEQGKDIAAQIKDKTGFDVNQTLGSGGEQEQYTTDADGNKGQAGQFGQEGQYGAVTGKGFGGDLAKNNNNQQSSFDAFGNAGQSGQFGQEGQYGAVTGKGFGGDLAKPGPNAMGGDQHGGVREGKSAYEGYEHDDSVASGGYGKNAGGDAFSRKNQMGADYSGAADFSDDEAGHGYKTGTSTPGYRQEGDVDAIAHENAQRNANMNVYGQQADDRGSKGNDYNEAI